MDYLREGVHLRVDGAEGSARRVHARGRAHVHRARARDPRRGRAAPLPRGARAARRRSRSSRRRRRRTATSSTSTRPPRARRRSRQPAARRARARGRRRADGAGVTAREGRPQRSVLVRERQEVQEVPRRVSARRHRARRLESREVVRRRAPIEAVRGIDVSIAPGETVALLGPNGAGKSTTIDMLLGLARPDAGTVTLFGSAARSRRSPRGAVGAMLQTGALIRDLSVRELVDDDGVALSDAARRRRGARRSTGIGDIADQRTQKLSGGQTQRVRFAVALVTQSGAARPRRADRGDGRREPARVLDDDARLRVARQDGAVRDALPRGGGRLTPTASC